jgi:hypothetical protein
MVYRIISHSLTTLVQISRKADSARRLLEQIALSRGPATYVKHELELIHGGNLEARAPLA